MMRSIFEALLHLGPILLIIFSVEDRDWIDLGISIFFAFLVVVLDYRMYIEPLLQQ